MVRKGIESCPSAWTVSGSGNACAGAVQEFCSGPVVMDQPLAGAASLEPGRVDHLMARIDFPTTSGDAHEDESSQLAFRFTAVQRDGAAQ